MASSSSLPAFVPRNRSTLAMGGNAQKNASSVSHQAGVNVAKRLDEPEQNYNEWIAGGWSKLLRLEPAVVAEHQTRTTAC